MASRIAGEAARRGFGVATSVGFAGLFGLIYLDVSDGKKDPYHLSMATATLAAGAFASAAGFAIAGNARAHGAAILIGAASSVCCFAIDSMSEHKKVAWIGSPVGPTGVPQIGDFFSEDDETN
jgi:hypothetical protein